MQKFYKVQFVAKLQKLTLGIKKPFEIQVFWKRGDKIAQSGKVNLQNCVACFDKCLSIQTTMNYDQNNHSFQYKKTKFSILLYGPQGTKQAGEIQFNVADYLNLRVQKPKKYELNLDKCPDKNAKFTFSLTAKLIQEVGFDNVSHASTASVNIENLVKNREQQDKQNQNNKLSKKSHSHKQYDKQIIRQESQSSLQSTKSNKPQNDTLQKIKLLQNQNKQLRQKVKGKQQLMNQNFELQKKLKNQDYNGLKELKKKIENGKKQIQALKSEISKHKNIQKQITSIQNEICYCKVQIMTAFNTAIEIGGGDLVDQLQQSCGFRQIPQKQT